MRLISRKFDTLSTYLASYLVNRLFYRGARLPSGCLKVMVFKLDNAGDVVISSLLMPRLSEALGGAKIIYVVRKGLGGLLGHIECVSDVIEVPAGLGHCSRVGADETGNLKASRKIVKKAIQEHRPDVIIDLRPTPLGNYGALRGFFSGARLRISLENQRLREVFGMDNGLKWARHEAETFFAVLQEAGLLPGGAGFRSSLTFWKVAPENRLMPLDRYFILQPGAVWDYKRWPERNFAALIDSLSGSYPDHSFVLAGSAAEYGVCERVRALTGKQARDKVVNMAGKTSLDELVSLIAGSEMVIANDSGIAHIAGAAGARTAVFFGPSSPERFMPLSERQDRVRVFHSRLACNPCDQHVCKEGPLTYCLARISPDEVIAYIRTVVKNGWRPELDGNGHKHATIA